MSIYDACYLNHADNTITITKDFAKRANKIGSKEYNYLMNLRHDWPTYVVIKRVAEKNNSQQRYKGLNFETMKTYIASVDGEDSITYCELLKLKEILSAKGGSFGTIKKWFLAQYPNYSDTSFATELASKLAAAEKSAAVA